MRSHERLAWSRAFPYGPYDLTEVTRLLLKGSRVVEESCIGLRGLVHEVPDRSLDEAVMRLERSAHDVTSLIEDLHREVLREFG